MSVSIFLINSLFYLNKFFDVRKNVKNGRKFVKIKQCSPLLGLPFDTRLALGK